MGQKEKTQNYQPADMNGIAIGLMLLILTISSCRRDSSTTGFTYGKDMYYPVSDESYDLRAEFPDSSSMLPSVEGTVQRNSTPNRFGKQAEDRIRAGMELVNPVELSNHSIMQGKQLYLTFCVNCHGIHADGRGNLVVSRVFLYAPSRLDTAIVYTLPDGDLYNVITNGFGVMGPLGEVLLPLERWKIVHYIKQGIPLKYNEVSIFTKP